MEGEKVAAYLHLEDGTVFKGQAFGSKKSIPGEVVFQTGMVGYPESLTDPSYCKQILVLTYPLIGNYGIGDDSKDQWGLPTWFESDKIHAAGLVVGNLCDKHSHWGAVKSLNTWMEEQGVPGICDIDTRALTKKIREKGTMLGKIIIGKDDDKSIVLFNPDKLNLVAEVSLKTSKTYNPAGEMKILAVDCGMKYNQIRCLCARGASVTVVPWDHSLDLGGNSTLFHMRSGDSRL